MIDTKAVEEMIRGIAISGNVRDRDKRIKIACEKLLEVHKTAAALLTAECGGTQNEFQAAMKALKEAMK